MRKVFFFLLVFFIQSLIVIGLNDPLIYDVKQLTQSGNHSFPVFTRDGRSIIFTAYGGQYGTKCSHVYELDLKYYEKWPASLFSTGIGHESQPFDYLSSDIYSIISTTYLELNRYTQDKPIEGIHYSNDYFCSQSVCENPEDTLVDACQKHHVEHFTGQKLTRIDLKTGMVKSMDTDSANWDSQHGIFAFGEVYSKKVDATSGELVYWKNSASREAQKSAAFTKGTFDGFNYYRMPNRHVDDFYFHGHEIPDDDTTTLDLINKGITPLENSKIYYTNYTLIQRKDKPTQCNKDDDPISYVFPRSFPDMKFVLATGINPTDQKMAIYRLDVNQNKVLVSDPTVNSFHAAIDYKGQNIVFVSDRDGKGNQLYLGKLGVKKGSGAEEEKKETMDFEAQAPIVKSYKQALLKNATAFTRKYTNKIRYPRMNQNGVLMFTAADTTSDCAQIYQIDSNHNDLLAKRKLSTGIHYHTSPNFLSNGDILFASTLSEPLDPKTLGNFQCHLKQCDQIKLTTDILELKTVCADVVEEYPLPKTMEIYIANQYGSIKERLTANDAFDGEVVVSPDQTKFVFSHFENGDYDLFEMSLTNRATKRVITKALGFERTPTYSPDGNMIAYVASRPVYEKEIDFYKRRLAYNFTDISQSTIFVFDTLSGREHELYTVYKINLAPVFLTNEQLVFVACESVFNCSLYGTIIKRVDDSAIEIQDPYVIEHNWPYMREMYINPSIAKDEKGFKLAYTQGNSYVYDLYLSQHFNPNFNVGSFSSTIKMSLPILFFILSFYLIF